MELDVFCVLIVLRGEGISLVKNEFEFLPSLIGVVYEVKLLLLSLLCIILFVCAVVVVCTVSAVVSGAETLVAVDMTRGDKCISEPSKV